mmetsp:Transcript_13007/g.20941  ORF Transcript_13007/g.20941 Transcript_13007/m.20941 type:complete len:477 (+) Transcript_13007:249-1679(+)
MQGVDFSGRRQQNGGCKPYLCRDGDLDLSDASAIANTDKYLARELQSLSIDELERVYEEIHGVAKTVEEDPKFVEEKLESLEGELKKIKDKTAYERALFLSPRYVRDPLFRKMFLRADSFDVRKAAARMINYFQYKMELFGEEKLVKKITLEDLTPDDMDELMSGSFQFLEEKDRCGRAVCFLMQRLVRYKTWQSKLRTVWYSIMSALENDDEAQKNGIVNIYYSVDLGSIEPLYIDLVRRIRIINDSLPYRNACTHYCYNNPAIQPALNILQLVAGKDNRVRFRTHIGSNMECQFSLMTFGLPNYILPLDDYGNLKEGVMENFIAKRKAIEAADAEAREGRIDYPNKMDILLGRGKPYQEYHGNAVLSTILNDRRDEYNNASRFEKTVISYDIVKRVHESKGRFIQRDEASGGWVIVPEAVAREKVSSGFRTRSRRQEEHTNSSRMQGRHSVIGEPGTHHRQKRIKMEQQYNIFK